MVFRGWGVGRMPGGRNFPVGLTLRSGSGRRPLATFERQRLKGKGLLKIEDTHRSRVLQQGYLQEYLAHNDDSENACLFFISVYENTKCLPRFSILGLTALAALAPAPLARRSPPPPPHSQINPRPLP